MAAKKSGSAVGTLIQGGGFLIAALLIAHIVFVLFDFRTETTLAQSVQQAAEPLALFFPGLLDVPSPQLQLIADYGLAAAFWMVLTGLLGRIFG